MPEHERRGRVPTGPSAAARLSCSCVGEPAALRASARSRSYASATAGASIAAIAASMSIPSVPRSAAAMLLSWSRSSVVVKNASCSARKAAHSRPGACKRTATIARQERPVPTIRCGFGARGMPNRRKRRAYPSAERSGA